MKNLIKILTIILVLVGNIYQANAQCSSVPKINSFSPVTGFIGSTVTIIGANFDATPSNNIIFFGATRATVLTASFGTLTVTVPVGASTAPISVTNNCDLTAYSAISFNGIFCPTPIDNNTYNNTTVNLTVPSGSYNMLSQDLDNDGKPELVSVRRANSGMSVAKNNSTPGSLSFSAVNFNGGGSSASTADFNGDGKRDIFTSQYIYRNTSTGPGNISFVQQGGPGGYQSNVGDFNNDGKIDLVMGSGSRVYFYLNTTATTGGVITYTPAGYAEVGQHSTGIQCADVDNDGKTDVLCTQGGSNRAATIRNITTAGSSSFSFESVEFWNSGGAYPYRCQIADFDKDGKIDLASVNFNSGGNTVNTCVWRNTSTPGNISFATVSTFPGPASNYRLMVGDVNGDGLPDIVTKPLSNGPFAVYANQSTGSGNISFSSAYYYSTAATSVSGVAIGDLDGDFVPDIATSSESSGRILVHRNTSAQNDVDAPTASCKNITVALSPTGSVTVTPAMIDNGSSDACGLDYLAIGNTGTQQNNLTFTCNDIGANSVVLYVVDNAGNLSTCTATVNVAPAAIIVAGQTTVCQGQTVTMTANDGDSYQWYKDGTAISGATSQTYVATVSGGYTVAVTNSGGCSGTSSATAVVVNNNPTVSVTPASVASLCSGSVTLTASTSSIYQWYKDGNAISGAEIQTYNATSTGTYRVEVTDLFGCSAVSSDVVVNNNPPEIDVLGNSTSIANGDITPSSSDGTDFGTVGSASTTYTISNSGSGSLVVSNISISGTGAGDYTLSGITLPATIASSGSTTFTVTYSRATLGSSAAAVNIASNDCDEAAYSFAIFGELNCTTPAFTTCPGDITQDTDDDACDAAVSYTTAVSGIPTPSLSYVFSGATTGSGSGNGSGSTFALGTTTVTVTATNVCGSVECEFDVTVEDNTNPTAICQNTTVTLSNGSASITAGDINDGSNDACGILSLDVNTSSWDCDDIGNHTVTLTVTDNNNNESTCTSTVTVDGAIPTATIASSANTSGTVIGGTTTYAATNQMFIGYGAQSMNITATASGGSSFTYSWTGSGLSSTSVSNPVFTPTQEGNYTLTCTVTNNYGCEVTSSITICVINAKGNGGNANNPKVLICHRPSGNPNNTQNISVSVNAVTAHLGNHGGCTLGACGSSCSSLNSYKVGGEEALEAHIYGESHLEVMVYPNPSRSEFNFILESPTDEMVSLKVFDIQGQLLTETNNLVPNDEHSFGTELISGVYMVVIKQGDFVKATRVVKIN